MIEFILGVIFAIAMVYIIAALKLRALNKRIDDSIEKTITKLRKSIIEARIDKVDDRLFLYNRITEEFIAQGNSFDELEKNARIKCPGKLFNVPQSELEEVTKGK